MNKLILSVAALLLIFVNSYSQENIKTHLFLGKWTMTDIQDAEIFEEWYTNASGDIIGASYFVKDGKENVNEILSLEFNEGNLNYCAIVFAQNDGNKICYNLKSYDDEEKIFIFENLNHDYPKRIIYKFKSFNDLLVRIEDDEKGSDFNFIRIGEQLKFYNLKGKIVKEPFVNKIGKEIPGVYDYFFEVQGYKYFIKNYKSDNSDHIDNFIGKEYIFQLSFFEGLWDADDNNHQSRVGKFIRIYLPEKP